MSYNGSGTFVINSAGQPVVANTVISATVFNALTADLATGLSTAITKDGQTTVTANIPFGSNKITGLGSGTAATDAANLGQVQSTAAKLITVTGTDTITGTMSPALTAYATGQLFYFIANGANTGAMTINVDGLGAKAITRDGATALIAGDVQSGEIIVICYDGTRFQMINAANSFGNTTINGTLTVTGDTALQANVSITSTLSVGGTFAVTGAATLGSTLAVTGKSDLPTVSTASMNAAVAVITTGTVTALTATGASIASANVGTAVITTGTVTSLTATGASVASANLGTAVITTGTVTGLTVTGASIASMNAGVALLTNATVTTLTATGASIASANIGNLQFTAASIASINAGVAVITSLTATGASIASMNAGVALLTTATVTNLTATGASIASANAGNLQVTGASIASANVGTAVITTGTVTNLTSTSASIASANAAVALITTGTVTNLTATGASIASANLGNAVITSMTLTGASVASVNAGVAVVTDLRVVGASITSANIATAVLTNNPTLNGGTANGVLYLNGSKVATSGSALVFDGTNLGIGTNSPSAPLHIQGADGFSKIRLQRASTQIYGVIQQSSAPYGLTYDAADGNTSAPAHTFRTSSDGSTFTEQMRLTSTGLGIGTSSPANKLHVNSGSTALVTYFNSTSASGAYSAWYNSDAVNGSVGAAAAIISGGSATNFAIRAESALCFATSGNTERARIDAAGNLGLGVTPNSGWTDFTVFQNKNAAILGYDAGQAHYTLNTYYQSGTWKYIGTSNAARYTQTVGQHQWYTAASGTAGGTVTFTQAMTLDASGNLLVGTTSSSGKLTSYQASEETVFFAQQAAATNTPTAIIRQSVSGGNGDNDIGLLVDIEAQNDTSRLITGRYWNGGTPATRFYVQRGGSVYNTTGTYGTISDAKVKQDIIDAPSQWDDIKSVRFRKYRMKDAVAQDENAPYLLGVVAQELEQTSPGLVEDGEIKTVKSSILLMKAAVALQEAMARIEKLEAEVAALKGA